MKVKFEEDVKLMEVREVKPGDIIKSGNSFYLVGDEEGIFRNAMGLRFGDKIQLSMNCKVEVFEGEVILKRKV